MTRSVFVYREGQGVVPRETAEPLYLSPTIIRDQMDALTHPVTGALIDSKSRFRQITRDAGCIEIGNEVQKPPPSRPDSFNREVAKARQMLNEGYRPNMMSRREWGE